MESTGPWLGGRWCTRLQGRGPAHPMPSSPSPADCTVKPCTKQLHLTLAHKFYPHHQRTLEQLAKAIPPDPGCQWTAALYSRDMRFVHYQVSRAGPSCPDPSPAPAPAGSRHQPQQAAWEGVSGRSWKLFIYNAGLAHASVKKHFINAQAAEA